jgi:hypothetical protein
LILRAGAERLRTTMLANVLPGLRELRAPLAAGYLWLLFAWMVWGDKLPSKSEEVADPARTPLDRFFELEPVVSSIGFAVLASVAAYVVGSIVIDVQTALGRTMGAALLRLIGGRAIEPGPLALAGSGLSTLSGWANDRETELRELMQRDDAVSRLVPDVELNRATHFAARSYIAANRDLLKTRLLDASEPLHSELDRPDAEATFRMAIWPPLTALVIYLALEVSSWWWFALVAPVLLAIQWINLRTRANNALVAAFVARPELGGQPAQEQVRRRAVQLIGDFLREHGVEDVPQSLYSPPAMPPGPSQPAPGGRVDAE